MSNEQNTLSPAHIEYGEEVEVVGTLIIGEQGWDNAIELNPGPVMALADAHPKSAMPLMTVAQHQRMTAALVARNERLEQVAVEAAETEKHALQVADAYRNGAALLLAAGELEKRVAALSAPPAADALEAIEWIDDFIARCNGDDRGSCESVNVLRRALASYAPPAAGVPEGCHECKGSGEVYDVSGDGPWSCYACSSNQEPAGYANLNELDNMLDDRTATLSPIKNGWYGVALYRAAPTPPASEQQRAVVMPERGVYPSMSMYPDGKEYAAAVGEVSGRNACLDELLRLNPHLAKGEGV